MKDDAPLVRRRDIVDRLDHGVDRSARRAVSGKQQRAGQDQPLRRCRLRKQREQ
ncbi:hypothetical protein U1707_08925 [Sphingomonas sp. PB2P12]